jgi:hypothetical protein
VLVLALLVGTGLAFVYTESLKLVNTPVRSTVVEPDLISPTCDCATGRARISFRLRKPDVLTVSIVDADGDEVRRLATERPARAENRVAFVWNGLVRGGVAAPEGVYRPRVRLDLNEKTIVLPNEIRVDTTRPKVTVRSVAPRTISPDGDGRADRVVVRYSVDELARTLLRVRDVRRAQSNFRRRGSLQWNGGADGRSIRPGTYRLSVVAIDRAGNRSRPAPAGRIRVRYVELPAGPLAVRPRARFRVRVETDARSYDWRFAGGTGTERSRTLELRAPRRPGRYVLFVTANGHGDSLVVRVRRPPPA